MRLPESLEEVIKVWPDRYYWEKPEPSLFVRTLREKGLTDEAISKVCQTIDEICVHCWESPKGCQCWNDD